MVESRQLLAVMFTDIVGYTSMASEDETHSMKLVESVNRRLRRFIYAHNGRWIQQVGDGTLSTFASAFDALTCAVQIQKAFYDGEKVNLRIGLHIGDIVIKEPNVWGSGVNIASRIESFAQKGEIIVSKSVKDALASHPEFNFQSRGTHTFKGVADPIEVFAIAALQTTTKPVLSKKKSRQAAAMKRARVSALIIALVAIPLLYIGYQIQQPKHPFIYFDAVGFANDSLPHASLLKEITRNLSKATGIPVQVSDQGSATLKADQTGLSLTTQQGELVFTSPNDAYANIHKISNAILASQEHISDTEKQNMSLYLDAYRGLDEKTTPLEIDNLITKIQSLLLIEPQNSNYQALLCRAKLRKEEVANAAISDVRENSSEACLALLPHKENNQNIHLALATYYLRISEYEFAETFLSKIASDTFDHYLTAVEILYDKGELEEAKRVVTEAREKMALVNQSLEIKSGFIDYELGNYLSSKRTFEEVVARDNRAYIAKKALAIILFNLGELEQSNQYFSELFRN